MATTVRSKAALLYLEGILSLSRNCKYFKAGLEESKKRNYFNPLAYVEHQVMLLHKLEKLSRLNLSNYANMNGMPSTLSM